MTHICVGKLTIIGSDKGLSPGRCQAIIWTHAGILLIGPLGTNFNEILIEVLTFSFKKMRLKMSSAKCCSFCLSPNVLTWLGISRWFKTGPKADTGATLNGKMLLGFIIEKNKNNNTGINFGQHNFCGHCSNRKCQDYVYIEWEYWSSM